MVGPLSKYQGGKSLDPHRYRRNATVAERFWGKVRIGAEGECWPWCASFDKRGYGQFGNRGTMRRAPRVAWELANGQDAPADKVVMHSCDNPACCNPAHLSLGTIADNVADMHRKGRASGGSMPGDKNPSAVLTAWDVREIRYLLSGGATTYDIAFRFNISRGAVSKIKNGRTWKDVA